MLTEKDGKKKTIIAVITGIIFLWLLLIFIKKKKT